MAGGFINPYVQPHPHHQHHHHHGPHHVPHFENMEEQPPPTGELITVYTEANPNYRLAIRNDGVVLAFKNKHDTQQHWLKVDMGSSFVDADGNPGFVLLNKGTGQVLKHGIAERDPVISGTWDSRSVDHSILWSQSNDVGNGWFCIRMLTNTSLNLDAERGDRKHGSIQDGHKLILFSWNKGENQKWKFEPVDVEHH